MSYGFCSPYPGHCMSTMKKENKNMKIQSLPKDIHFVFYNTVCNRENLVDFHGVLTLRASLGVADPREFPHPLRCVTLAVGTLSPFASRALCVRGKPDSCNIRLNNWKGRQ